MRLMSRIYSSFVHRLHDLHEMLMGPSDSQHSPNAVNGNKHPRFRHAPRQSSTPPTDT